MYLLRDDLAIVQSVDVISPIADDPVDFGRIAAANALSDVYAMGGSPVTALSIVAFPVRSEPPATFKGMLAGGIEVLEEAGAALVGGHSIDDPELKLGFSITGVVDPARIIRKSGAKPGDVLVLTKPLGTGLIATAAKKRKASADVVQTATESMCSLNAAASAAAVGADVISGTDVTGFGLLGHLREMVLSSGVEAELKLSAVPLLPGARDFAGRGFIPGGTGRNEDFVRELVDGMKKLDKDDVAVLCDPQTSGGLLLAVPEASLDGLLGTLNAEGVRSSVVGRVVRQTRTPRIRVIA